MNTHRPAYTTRGFSRLWIKFVFCVLASVLAILLQSPPVTLGQQITPPGPTDPEEVAAFADIFFPEQMAARHIPGAVLVVVRQGEILLAKGYGYANLETQAPMVPESTVLCTGSIGKLFTSTALLQLKERGQLDLQDDVNLYLPRWQLEASFPNPVTFVHLLTHTGGFDERKLGVWVPTIAEILPLEAYLSTAMPPRVRPPGQVIQYSDHGMAVAGYLVEVISGAPFATYIEQHIFQPLGMEHSSFRQPLPRSIQSDLAVGYTYQPGTGYRAVPLYYSNVLPAGPLYASATDIAAFMIAHLQLGRYQDTRILLEPTAWEMQAQHFTNDPRLPGFAYGFAIYTYNAHRILAHGGACKAFTSLLFLMPDADVGFFVSVNALEGGIMDDFASAFIDHYYPAPPGSASLAAVPSGSLASMGEFAGAYRINKHARTTVEKSCALAQDVRIVVEGGGQLSLVQPHQRTQWMQIDDALFRAIDGADYLAFHRDATGHVDRLFLTAEHNVAYDKLAWYETSAFHLNLRRAVLVFFLLAVVAGPLFALVSRNREVRLKLVQPHTWLLRLLYVTVSLLFIAFYLGWRFLPLGHCEGALSWPLYTVLTLSTLVAILTLGLSAGNVFIWWRRCWTVWERLLCSMVTLCALVFSWSLHYWRLLGFWF